MQTFAYMLGAFFLFFAIMFLVKKRRLRGYAKQRIAKLWEAAEATEGNGQRVLEADKVLHAVYKELGYKGSLGACLKRHGHKLPNEQDVWEAHKLRNKLAHEPGCRVSSKQAARALQSFRRAVYSFM